MDGKVVVVTGGNAGIGYETARALLPRGCKVILACRSETRASEAVEKLKKEFPETEISYTLIDLSSLKSVRDCAKRILSADDKIDVLVNNAGIVTAPALTDDGFDIHFQTNHLGSFYLTKLLIDALKKSDQGRIINVSSGAYKWGRLEYEYMKAIKTNPTSSYSNSKLCNILFTKGLEQRLTGSNVTANALHPGLVDTNISSSIGNTSLFWRIFRTAFGTLAYPFMRTAQHGAQTSIHLTLSPKLSQVSGKYFVDCKEVNIAEAANDPEKINGLWKKSEEYIKEYEDQHEK